MRDDPLDTAATPGTAPSSWSELAGTPVRLRVYLGLVALAALVVPIAVPVPIETIESSWVTVLALVSISVLNVEIGRVLSGGLSTEHQPHKALSAWAFASALLLPTPFLPVVVTLTYLHARWRGIRIPLWKWVGSGCFLVLCGYVAALVRHLALGPDVDWMRGDGGPQMLAMLAAGAVFLAVETLLFLGSATFNHAEDEVWLRTTLRSATFYATEAGVLLVGGLFCAVWAGGIWYTVFFLPLYVLVQHAVLVAPLRERAAVAEALAAKNDELGAKNGVLEQSNQFKVDLLGMLGHELGNPLTSVSGFAELGVVMAGQRGEAESVRSFEIIGRSAGQMRTVLADILSLVSSERGALVAAPEFCPLALRLRHLVAHVDGGDRIALECDQGLAAWVQPGHVDQIVGNLLSNAQKYGGGAVAVRVVRTGDGFVEIHVVDCGPGVPAEFREHLFLRYSRDADTAQRVMGTGLGLFISRELAHANGGDLEYRAAEPQGSDFVLRLPEA